MSADDALALPTEPTPPQLVALSPTETVEAQQTLLTWIAQQKAEAEAWLAELEQNLHLAAEARMQTDQWRRQLRHPKNRLIYLDKLEAALQAGYLLIPNLPMTVFAIRTAKAEPTGTATSDWSQPSVPLQAPQPNLPVGAGRYVSPRPEAREMAGPDKNAKGEAITRYLTEATEFRDADFPVVAVKPRVLEATQRALALKVFDEVGLVTGGGDPILVGRVNHWRDARVFGRGATFFLAWFLDVRTLA